MKSLKKTGLLVLAVSALSLAACGSKDEGPKYERGSDEAIYDAALGEYEQLCNIAREIKDDDARYVAYAAAEAALLDSGVMIPTTTQNGAYAITRVAPRTVPYVSYGIDEDKLNHVLAVKGGQDNFLKTADREKLLADWEEIRGTADAKESDYFDVVKAYFASKNYELADTYKTTFSSAPQTLDVLGTSRAADTEFLTNGVEGLVGYNSLGFLEGKVAKSWDYTIVPEEKNADGSVKTPEHMVWKFVLQDEGKRGEWVDNEGNSQGAVTADDFVAGFQHMLDAQGGLDYLVDGIVVGVHEYLAKTEKDFSKVGIRAVDDGAAVEIELTKVESFFPTRLVYSCFMPLNRAFYQSKGGVFGIDELAAAKTAGTYKYGVANDPASIAYNGAFTCTQLDAESQIVFAQNTKYRDNATTTVKSLTWVYDAGEDPDQTYADVRSGIYPGMSLSASTGTLDYAKRDGIFDDYKYITETNATTFFGGMNMNRGTFELASGGVKSEQTEAQKIAINKAMNNINFRRAIQHGWDRAAYNAVSRGKDLATTNLRNMYTQPEFVSLSNDISDKGLLELINGFFTCNSEDFEKFENLLEFETAYYRARHGYEEDIAIANLEYNVRYSRAGRTQTVDFYTLFEGLSSLGLAGKATKYGDLVQFFFDMRTGAYSQSGNGYGYSRPTPIREADLSDGKDGWYNAKLAREYFWDYILEAGSDFPAEGLVIDNVYYGGSTAQTAQANAFKQSIEDSFTFNGKKYVTVNLVAASTVNDYYYSGYYCESGEEINQDIFYGSGWGPDYADPSTYLDTFERTAGYMVMTLGINNHQKSAA